MTHPLTSAQNVRVFDAQVELDQRRRPTSVADLQRLRGRVSTHLSRLEEAALDDPSVAARVGGQLDRVLQTLLDSARQLNAEQRSVLRSAVEYFVMTDDEQNDLAGPDGLADDVAVAVAACRALGRSDLIAGLR